MNNDCDPAALGCNEELGQAEELNILLVAKKDASWAPETLAALIDAALATKQFFPAKFAKKYPEFAQQWPELFLTE